MSCLLLNVVMTISRKKLCRGRGDRRPTCIGLMWWWRHTIDAYMRQIPLELVYHSFKDKVANQFPASNNENNLYYRKNRHLQHLFICKLGIYQKLSNNISIDVKYAWNRIYMVPATQGLKCLDQHLCCIVQFGQDNFRSWNYIIYFFVWNIFFST